MAVRIPVDNWFGYSEILDQSPLSTKAITSATVYTIGDLIAQRTEGSSMGELDRVSLIWIHVFTFKNMICVSIMDHCCLCQVD